MRSIAWQLHNLQSALLLVVDPWSFMIIMNQPVTTLLMMKPLSVSSTTQYSTLLSQLTLSALKFGTQWMDHFNQFLET